jgi:tetratricopeptide (TPR) repeat protein
MYTQAMKGSHQIGLDYANILLQIIQHAYGCWYDESTVQVFRKNEELVRQERAVILRLMGKYEEALREFDDLLAHGEDYECLIQMSYLKHLMGDKSGALEYARQAKKIESPEVDKPGYGAFVLGFKALPDEYRQWLRSVT